MGTHVPINPGHFEGGCPPRVWLLFADVTPPSLSRVSRGVMSLPKNTLAATKRALWANTSKISSSFEPDAFVFENVFLARVLCVRRANSVSRRRPPQPASLHQIIRFPICQRFWAVFLFFFLLTEGLRMEVTKITTKHIPPSYAIHLVGRIGFG